MDKLIKKIADRIVHMPYDFQQKNKSVYSLLKETGYFEYYDYINEDIIANLLKKDPLLIDQWLQWSEDKRTSTGWYITKGNGSDFFVGHYPESKEFDEIITTDKFYACAAFIKRESESTRVLFTK